MVVDLLDGLADDEAIGEEIDPFGPDGIGFFLAFAQQILCALHSDPA